MAAVKSVGTVDVELSVGELELIRRALRLCFTYGGRDDERLARELLADLEVTD